MRPAALVVLTLLTASAWAGCLEDATPEPFVLPQMAIDDTFSYRDTPGSQQFELRIRMLPPVQVLDHELQPVVAFPAEVETIPVTRNPSVQKIVLFGAAGEQPIVGFSWASGTGEDGAFHPTADEETPPNGQAGLLAFHGFGARTLSLGTTWTLPASWASYWTGTDSCTLRIDRILYEGPEARAEARCAEPGADLRVVFSERSPYPLLVEGRHTYQLTSYTPGDTPRALAERDVSPLTMVEYGQDGPREDGQQLALSLAAATREVRESPIIRKAKQCLDERPEALLTQASVHIRPDSQSWTLRWSAPEGDCVADVDSRSTSSEVWLGDRIESPTEVPESWSDGRPQALSLGDVLRLWDETMQEAPTWLRLTVTEEGGVVYDLKNEDGAMMLDAAPPVLNFMDFQFRAS